MSLISKYIIPTTTINDIPEIVEKVILDLSVVISEKLGIDQEEIMKIVNEELFPSENIADLFVIKDYNKNLCALLGDVDSCKSFLPSKLKILPIPFGTTFKINGIIIRSEEIEDIKNTLDKNGIFYKVMSMDEYREFWDIPKEPSPKMKVVKNSNGNYQLQGDTIVLRKLNVDGKDKWIAIGKQSSSSERGLKTVEPLNQEDRVKLTKSNIRYITPLILQHISKNDPSLHKSLLKFVETKKINVEEQVTKVREKLEKLSSEEQAEDLEKEYIPQEEDSDDDVE